ncbi:hypothetical protein MKEN_00805500 [Mycena kentingensis (nom. inval.)]|nr:hypothetical protein MKEN_00805500 [Mycena kentingensis (nom. inval.)]
MAPTKKELFFWSPRERKLFFAYLLAHNEPPGNIRRMLREAPSEIVELCASYCEKHPSDPQPSLTSCTRQIGTAFYYYAWHSKLLEIAKYTASDIHDYKACLEAAAKVGYSPDEYQIAPKTAKAWVSFHEMWGTLIHKDEQLCAAFIRRDPDVSKPFKEAVEAQGFDMTLCCPLPKGCSVGNVANLLAFDVARATGRTLRDIIAGSLLACRCFF